MRITPTTVQATGVQGATLLLPTPYHPFEKTLFELPKKGKLPQQRAVYQQENVVNRQYQDVVQNTEPHWMISIRESHVQQWFFDEHNRRTRTGKNKQYNDYLPNTAQFPAMF
jgi:hypothetical protein